MIDMLLHAVEHYSIVAASTLEEGGHILRSSSARYTKLRVRQGRLLPPLLCCCKGAIYPFNSAQQRAYFFPNRLFTNF